MATYTGGTGNDLLTGSIFSDDIYGGAGNDTINAGSGTDTVFGGDGADSINAGSGDDLVYAEGGNDTVTASTGYDTIFGGAGNDNLSGGSDMWDDLYGGTGDDSLYGGSYGQNWVYGGDGNDLVYGGAGTGDIASGGSGRDTVFAGMGDDTALGGTGNDLVYGEAGNDFATGDDGNDTVDGGTGADTVEGGQGHDSLIGGDGADVIRGDIRTFDPASFTSGPSNTATTVTFTNTSTLTVKLFYIDGSGTPQLYATLTPGQSFSANTFVEHNWMLTDAATGSNLAIYEGGVAQSHSYAEAFNDTISGGQGADTIFGDFGDDSINAGTENDQVFGGTGNDTVFGGWGDDYAELGDGNDVFGDWTNDSGNDTIFGGAGSDAIIGASDNDLLYGGDGNDTVYGGHGNDSSYGGAGNDVGGVTEDHMQDYYDLGENAGDFDIMSFGNYLTSTGVTVSFSGTDAGSYTYGSGQATGTFIGAEGVSGTNFNDTINASADTDGATIWGNAGADSITTGVGNDLIDGGTGNDTIVFGTGNDSVYGGDGDDSIDDNLGGWTVGDNLIDAGAGNDTIWSGAGNDTVYGGTGNDLIDDSGGVLTGASFLSGDAGDDTIWAGGSNDSLYGGSGDDFLGGEADDDLIEGGLGNDTLIGDDGADTLQADEGNDSLTGGAGTDVLDGGAGNDTLYGDSGNDSLFGGSEDDALFGGAGADNLQGGAGNDTLQGDEGNDTLEGGAGADLVSGGDGDDRFLLNATSGNDTIIGGEGAEGAGDTLDGSAIGANTSVIFSGNEAGTATAGGSTVSFSQIEGFVSGGGNDLFNAAATTTGVSVNSGGGSDSLIGGSGNDVFSAGAGNDTLRGGAGNDTLTGGNGSDRFDLIEAGGGDTITDFNMALSQGITQDRLDVSALQNPDNSPVKAWDVTITDDGNGNAVLTFPEGESVVLQGVSPASVTVPGMLAAMGVPCFVAGTRIMTPQGPRAVERLCAGDLVSLADGGSAPIIWAGLRRIPQAALAHHPGLRPIRIAAGRHGALRDVLLSPQHAVEVSGPQGQALVRAGQLARLGWDARQALGVKTVQYHHILLPRHSLILADGLRVESLYPGRLALSGFLPTDRAALIQTLATTCPPGPSQSLAEAYGPRCLPLLTFEQAKRWQAARRDVLTGLGNHPSGSAAELTL